MKPTKHECDDFAQFCAQATDAQIQNIFKKEAGARRFVFARIAEHEMKRRGIEREQIGRAHV